MWLLMEMVMIVLLGILVYQDFRYRLISGVIVAVLFLLSIGYSIMQVGGGEWVINFSANMGIVAIELFVCWMLLRLRSGRKIQFADNYLGWGDILFFVIMASMFSTFNFILLLPLALFVIMMVCLAIRIFGFLRDNKIPLAGALSLLLAGMKILFITQKKYFYFENIAAF